MPYYEIDGIRPVVHPQAYVHPTAVVIGDVDIAADCYVGPCAVLRGDFGPLRLKQGSNLQDTCVMHGFPNIESTIERNGHVGHGAILHGCHICQNAMIGMNAVLMDQSQVGENSIVAAMSFVKAESQLPANSLIMGTPAKVVRELTIQEIKWKKTGTHIYQQLSLRCKTSMVETTPLAEPEKNRRHIQIDYPTLRSFKKESLT